MAELKDAVIPNTVVKMVRREDGSLQVMDNTMKDFRNVKERIPLGGIVECEFRTPRREKSDVQMGLFHAIRDRYAQAMGYDREYAKSELCLLYGVSQEIQAPSVVGIDIPKWSGHIVSMWGGVFFRKSLTEYTKKELYNLTEGCIMACHENSIDVADLLQEYKIERS